MGNVTLSVPTVIVNNIPIKIVPNSFVYDGGEGEINVRAASAGGSASNSVHSQNAESHIGKVKFDIYLTKEVDGYVKDWKDRVGANSIEAIQSGQSSGESVAISWNHMSLTNDVEREASADGVTSLEFEGDQMSA